MTQLWDTSKIQPCNDIVLAGETIPALFWNGVTQRGPDVWMRQKHLGLWRSWTWTQTADAVREIAAGLLSLGFAKGDCASILANTAVDWVWADLAVLSAGGVSNGIYPTDSAAQVEYLSTDSASVYLFVEDDEQLDKAYVGLPDYMDLGPDYANAVAYAYETFAGYLRQRAGRNAHPPALPTEIGDRLCTRHG